MRAVFSLVSLIVVLAVVGTLVVKQMRATGQALPEAAKQAGVPALAASGNVRDQSRQIQQQIANDVNKALQQGAGRNANADQ
jgi:predicted PurR-regulated permease PerM